MKRILFIGIGFLLLMTSFTSDQEFFEGVIVYEHIYETDNPNIDVAQLAKIYGTKSEFYFKDGNYKQIFNGDRLKLNLFLNKENKIYTQNGNTDTLTYIDCSYSNESIINSEVSKNADTILNRNCNLFSIKTNSPSGKFYRNAYYYFDESLKINPSWFKNVKYGSLDEIYSETKSLPLKIIGDRGSLKITMKAIAVKKQKLKNDFFQIPSESIVVQQKL